MTDKTGMSGGVLGERDIFGTGESKKYKCASCVGIATILAIELQAVKCSPQLGFDLTALFAHDGRLGSDHHQKAGLKRTLAQNGAIPLADDPLGTVAHAGPAHLFGDRDTDAIDRLAFGMSSHQSARRIVLEHVYGDTRSRRAASLLVRLIIKMMLLDRSKLHGLFLHFMQHGHSCFHAVVFLHMSLFRMSERVRQKYARDKNPDATNIKAKRFTAVGGFM